ncbi:hypothetical protein G9A89_009135 [Geosiphon pyriformis]|nr:hypothetical protein G9A89_009135 [Geosiphon pyriformis]
MNHFQNQSCLLSLSAAPNQPWQPKMCVCHNCDSESLPKSRPISNHLPANDAATNLSTASISISNLSTAATSNLSAITPNNLSAPTTKTSGNPRPRITQNWRSAIVVYQLIPSSSYQPLGSRQQNSGTGSIQNPNSQNYLSLLITSENAQTNKPKLNQQQPLTNNIPPATITNNELLAAIFLFKLKESSSTPLFSDAVFEKKPITTMYTNTKVDEHAIKLILDSGSAGTASTRFIIADGTTKTPISEIDDFPIKINGIIVPIKVLVMNTTQYQALVGNDWLFKTNAMLD